MKKGTKQQKQARKFWLPGATSWECWKTAPRGGAELADTREEMPDDVDGCPVMIPSRYVSCLTFWVPTADSGDAREMVPLLAEKAGLQTPNPEDPGTQYIEILARKENASLVRLLCLSPSLPIVMQTLMADYFFSSVHAYPPKSAGFYLWSEMGIWILGVVQDEQWKWVQPLSARSVGATLAQEIRLIWMRLVTDKVYDGPTRLTVWAGEGEAEAHFQEMGAMLRWMVEVLERPQPHWPDPCPALMPPDVLELKKSAARKRQFKQVGGAILAVLVLGLIAMGGHLIYLSQQIKTISADQASRESTVADVQAAASLWDQMEPALAIEYSPLQALSQITTQLPAEGIRIIRFESDNYTFRLDGEARNVQIAVAFSEQLRRAEEFQGYTWSTPSPSNLPGGLASFTIRAERPGAPDNES